MEDVTSESAADMSLFKTRVDAEVRRLSELCEDPAARTGPRSVDDGGSKVNGRLERLGKEISMLKARQTDLSSAFDEATAKLSFMGEQM